MMSWNDINFSFILEFIFVLKLHVQNFGYSVIGHDVSSLNLTETDYENLLLLIKLVSPSLDLSMYHLSIFAMDLQ